MSTDKHTQLLDELQGLLERQIESVRQGNISNVEALGRQADSLVKEISETGTLESVEFQKRAGRLQKLYEELCLSVAAQRDDISRKLSRVRRGRKVIGTYRNSIRPQL